MPATRLQILTAVVALGLAGSLAAAIPAAAAGPPGPRPTNEGPQLPGKAGAASAAESGQGVPGGDDQQAAADSHPGQHVGVLLVWAEDR